jgi:hypothetical protein
MRFLRSVPCAHCGNTLAVPTRGEYRIQCNVCEKMNGTLPAPIITLIAPTTTPVATSHTQEPLVTATLWHTKMKKEELLSIALSLGISLEASSTKKEIEAALRAITPEKHAK